jgi:predicted negative regulator of RcsB-dependent stress response
MGRYEQSVPHLERAVELLPYDPVINDHLGDAYWRVGRKLEARFQWERASNHTEEQELSAQLAEKLRAGLAPADLTKINLANDAAGTQTNETIQH